MKLVTFFIIFTSTVFAEPVTMNKLTIGTKTYEQATITLADPATARIAHSSGIARVPIASLDEVTRQSLGFDPNKAAAHRIATLQAQHKAEHEAFIRNAPSLKIRILSVTTEGLHGRCTLYHPNTKAAEWQGEAFLETYTKDMNYLDGEIHTFKAVRRGTYQFTTVLGATRTIARFLPASSKAAFTTP